MSVEWSELNPRTDMSEANPGPWPCSWASRPAVSRRSSHGELAGDIESCCWLTVMTVSGSERSTGVVVMVIARSRAGLGVVVESVLRRVVSCCDSVMDGNIAHAAASANRRTSIVVVLPSRGKKQDQIRLGAVRAGLAKEGEGRPHGTWAARRRFAR